MRRWRQCGLSEPRDCIPPIGFARSRYYRGFTAAVLLAAVSGCAYVNPYVSLQPEGATAEAGKPMPAVSLSLSKIDKWIAGVEEKRNYASKTRRILNLATFGLASAAGIVAVRSSRVESMKNLALGAGVTYTGTALFLPSDQIDLYNSANTALVCIRGRGAGLRSAVIEHSAQLDVDLPYEYVHSSLTPTGCNPDKDTKAAYDAAEAARMEAVLAVGQAAQSDSAVATALENAAMNVVQTLDTQLDLIAPSASAILASAKSSTEIASGLTTSTPSGATQKLVAKGVENCTDASPVQLRKKLNALQKSYGEVQGVIAQQLNAIAELNSACTLSPLKLAALTLN